MPSGLPGEGHPVPPVVRIADGVVGDGRAVEGGFQDGQLLSIVHLYVLFVNT